MTDTTPVWFLDVDGVINALSWAVPKHYSEGSASPVLKRTFSVAERAEDPDYDWDAKEDDLHSRERYQIRWNPDITAEMREMHESGIVKIVWLTTWGDGANYELASLVGLPELEVVANPPEGAWSVAGGGGSGRWWKHDAVQDYVAQSDARKFIWTDDDLPLEKAAFTWAREHGKIYPLAPSVATGLMPNQLSDLRRWITT